MRPIREKKILHVNRENYELGSRISRFNRALFIYNEVIMDMYLWICIYADVAVLHPIQLLIANPLLQMCGTGQKFQLIHTLAFISTSFLRLSLHFLISLGLPLVVLSHWKGWRGWRHIYNIYIKILLTKSPFC